MGTVSEIVPGFPAPGRFEYLTCSVIVHVDVLVRSLYPGMSGQLLQGEKVHAGELRPSRDARMAKAV